MRRNYQKNMISLLNHYCPINDIGGKERDMVCKIGDKVKLTRGIICTIKDIIYWTDSSDIYGYTVAMNGKEDVVYFDDIEQIIKCA